MKQKMILLYIVIGLLLFYKVGYAQPNAGAHVNLGDEHFALKDYEAAIAEYTKAINIDPKLKVAYAKRGLCYNIIGEYDKSNTDLTKSPPGSNTNISYYKAQAENYVNLRLFKKAIVAYNKIISMDHSNENWYVELAKLNILKKNYKAAIRNCDLALAIKFNNPDAYYYKGIGYICLSIYEQAIINLNFAISIRPNYTEAYGARGFAKLMIDDYPGASADWQSAGEWGSKYREVINVKQGKRIIKTDKKGKQIIQDQKLNTEEKEVVEQPK